MITNRKKKYFGIFILSEPGEIELPKHSTLLLITLTHDFENYEVYIL